MKTKNNWAAISEVIFNAAMMDPDQLCPPLRSWPWKKPKKGGFEQEDNWAFASSKPLPPLQMPFVLGMLINELEACAEVARFLPENQSRAAIQETTNFMINLMDDCGTDKYEQLIAALLKKLKKGPFPPEPGPQPDWLKQVMKPNERIILAAVLGQYAKQNLAGEFAGITAKGQEIVESGFEGTVG